MNDIEISIENLIKERGEISVKADALGKSIHGIGFFAKYGKTQFELALLQHYSMVVYRMILEMRIDELKSKKEKMSTNLNFGQAIQALKHGKRVAREGWNGKNMWLEYNDNDMQMYKEFKAVPFIGLKTPKNTFVAWNASQEDALSEDWIILE